VIGIQQSKPATAGKELVRGVEEVQMSIDRTVRAFKELEFRHAVINCREVATRCTICNSTVLE
jgi:hypothetical protein